VKTARALVDLVTAPPASSPKRKARARGSSSGPGRRKVYILPGNHDAHDRAGRVYSVDLYDALDVPGIEVIGMDWNRIVEGISFSAIPWVPDRLFRAKLEEYASSFDFLRPEAKNVLLFHQSVKGARDGAHVAGGSCAAPVAFDPWDLALSGHIHEPQRLGVVQYLGAPLHLRFTDAGRPRGFWAMDAHAEIEFVETSFPRFVRWRFLEDDDVGPDELAEALLPELVGEIASSFSEPIYLDVVVEGEKDAVDRASSATREALQSLPGGSLRRVKVSAVYTDQGASERVRRAATSPGSVASPTDLVEAFVAASSAKYPAGVSADELVDFGRGVLR
jgi:DNA repair exonuclease SbcCD nuclease subunit